MLFGAPVRSSRWPSSEWWYWSIQPAEMPCLPVSQSQKLRLAVFELPSTVIQSMRQKVTLNELPLTTGPVGEPLRTSNSATSPRCQWLCAGWNSYWLARCSETTLPSASRISWMPLVMSPTCSGRSERWPAPVLAMPFEKRR